MSDGYDDQFGVAFQHQILAVMAQDPGFVMRFRTALDPDYFSTEADQVVARALIEHVDTFRVLPTKATLIEQARPLVAEDDFDPVRSRITACYKADVGDAVSVIEKAVEFGKQQALVNAVLSAAVKLEKGDRNVRGLIDDAMMVGEDLLDIGVDYSDDEDQVARYGMYTDPEIHGVQRIRTGIAHLDEVMGGGLGRGELGVVVAPPKRGKTTTLINLGFGAMTALNAYNVAHYSCEMREPLIVQRYDSRLMGPRLKWRTADPPRFVQELSQRMGQFIRGRLVVKAYPTRTLTPSMIRAHLTLLASRGFRPDLIIVDYADIMRAERRIGDMRHEQAGIYEDLRTIAGEWDAGVWTGSQTGRGALDKETVTMADFSEAFEKAAIVDAAIGLCQTDDERIEQRCRLFTAALRNSEDGRTVEAEINRTFCRIKSTGILDAAGDPIASEPGKKSKVQSVKQAAGLTASAQKKASKKRTKKPPTKELNL